MPAMNDGGTTTVDRADADTGPPPAGSIRRLARNAGRPPAWPFHGICLAATIALLWAASVPAGDLGWALASAVVLTVLAAVWFVRTIAALFTRQTSWWNLVAPIGGLLVASLLWADVPLHARWTVSAGAFDGAAVEYLALFDEPKRQHVPGDRTIGAYRIDGVSELRSGGLVFSIADSGLVFSSGHFYYLPDGSSPRDHRSERDQATRVTDLGDGWFAVVETW